MFIFSFSQKSGAKNSNYEVIGEEMEPSKAKNKNWKFFFFLRVEQFSPDHPRFINY